MIVREARPEDAAGVRAIHAQAAAERRWIATQPEEIASVEEEAARIAAWRPETGALLVAQEHGHIIGICGVRRSARMATRHTAEVGLTVAAAHQGRGVGRALMLEAEAWARRHGIARLALGAFHDNERALRLYRSLGFHEEGVRRGHYVVGGVERDEVLMAKRIDVQIVLASASPRRRKLMEGAGYRFRVMPSEADESTPPGMPAEQAVVEVARRKARAVDAGDALVLAADTIVALGDEILGKPRDAADARRILARLSGREHRVLTGVAARRGARLWSGVETTKVRFRELSEDEIAAYVATGEPLDKAGAYAIQGGAAGFVEAMDGPLDNVVGLPMGLAARLLDEAQRGA